MRDRQGQQGGISKGAQGNFQGDKCILYLDSGEGFLDVCTCQSLLNCMLLHVQHSLCHSCLRKAEREAAGHTNQKQQGEKNNGEEPGTRARQGEA